MNKNILYVIGVVAIGMVVMAVLFQRKIDGINQSLIEIKNNPNDNLNKFIGENRDEVREPVGFKIPKSNK